MVEKKKWKAPEAPKVKEPELVQVTNIKASTGSFSVDIPGGVPFSIHFVEGVAYSTLGSGDAAKEVKGVPKYVADALIDPSKYWLVVG